MAENKGLFSWDDIGKTPAWLTQEIGTGCELSIADSIPGAPTGIDTPAGHVHQSGGASPKASSGADQRISRVLTFDPFLAKVTYQLLNELIHTQRQGLPSLMTPFPRIESWAIRDDARATWSLAGTIAGTGGVRTGFHVVPKVNIRDASGIVTASTVPAEHPGASTLTIVSGTPAGSDEIQIDPAVDTTALVTGDLSTDAGRSLVLIYFGFVPVQVVGLSNEYGDPNVVVSELEVIESPSQKDYELDV